jgi:hypothetical protein
MTTKTLYKVIGFGTNEHGFFNQFCCSSSIGYACGFYTAHLQDPEMDGAVIIKCEHEEWEVIQEFALSLILTLLNALLLSHIRLLRVLNW